MFPGFLAATPAPMLVQLPRYLKALALRQERALQHPAKDQTRMLSVKAFNDAAAALKDAGRDTDAEVARFRQDVEELNVQVFAQELALKGAVSEKRLAKQLAALI